MVMNSMEKSIARRQKALDEDKAVIGMMKDWRSFFDSLLSHRGMSVMAFAEKYGFSDSLLSHQIAGRRGGSLQYAKRVEASLKKELGVKLWKKCVSHRG